MLTINYLQFLAQWAITEAWTSWVKLMFPDSTAGKLLVAMS